MVYRAIPGCGAKCLRERTIEIKFVTCSNRDLLAATLFQVCVMMSPAGRADRQDHLNLGNQHYHHLTSPIFKCPFQSFPDQNHVDRCHNFLEARGDDLLAGKDRLVLGQKLYCLIFVSFLQMASTSTTAVRSCLKV